MGTKKTKSTGSAAGGSRLSRQLEELLDRGQSALEEFFVDAPIAELRQILEGSGGADLVNVLLDLRHASVKTFFERVVSGRKRLAAPTIALYHYRSYLLDTVPFEIKATNGEKLPNYYAILGVPRDATADDIGEAHKHLLKAFSPEFFAESEHEKSAERLAEINDAFGNLKTDAKRETTDRLLPNINYLYPKRDVFWLDSVRRLLN
jgi:hypothetical protein